MRRETMTWVMTAVLAGPFAALAGDSAVTAPAGVAVPTGVAVPVGTAVPVVASAPVVVAPVAVAAASAGGGVPTEAVAQASVDGIPSGPKTVTGPGAFKLVTSGLQDDGVLRVQLAKGALLTTAVAYKTVSVGQPEVADVTPVGEKNILVTAKKAGATQLIVFDEAGRSQVVDVVVTGDADALKDLIKTTFPAAKVDVVVAGGAVVLRGTVKDVQTAERIATMSAPYGKVLNFMEVPGGRQVTLHVRFAEVSKSASTQLGINFAGTDGVAVFGSNVGQVNPQTALTPGQVGASSINPSVTLFGSGRVASLQFEYFLSALRQNSLMRVLAEPNVTAISGQEANLVAGGSFPIPVSQGGGSGVGGAAVTIEYKEYGIKLKFLPVVEGDGKIRLKVEPEVSDLDYTNAVTLNGFRVPALTKRTVTTTVELSEGQTFAIAGLLNNRVQANKEVTPLLGDLPFIGSLFRSVQYQRQETELVVLITPYLVEPMNPGQVPPVPGEVWRHPTEAELFWNQDLGGPDDKGEKLSAATPGGPPKFRGPYGFVAPSAAPQPGKE